LLKNFVAIHKQHELTKIARFSLYEFSHAPQGTQPNSFHARAASFAEQHANSFKYVHALWVADVLEDREANRVRQKSY